MITVWRICAETFKEDIFSGEGAAIYGNRWNSKGNRVVYTAQSLSLATLEYLVHLAARQIQDDFVFAKAAFPEEVVAEVNLPQTWLNSASSAEFKDVGDRWIHENMSAVLRVPSVISNQEYNYLFNPQHLDFYQITLHDTEPFRFDPRLVKQQEP